MGMEKSFIRTASITKAISKTTAFMAKALFFMDSTVLLIQANGPTTNLTVKVYCITNFRPISQGHLIIMISTKLRRVGSNSKVFSI